MSKHIYIENNRLALHEDVASLQSDKQDKLIAGNNITIASDGKTINASLSNLNDVAIYRLQLSTGDTFYVNTNQSYGPGTVVYEKFQELINLQSQWWSDGIREAILQISHLGFRNNGSYIQSWLNSADQALLLSAKGGDGSASTGGNFWYYTFIYQQGRSMAVTINVEPRYVIFYLTIVPDVRTYSTMPTATWSRENTVALYIGPTTSTYTNNSFYLCVNNSGTYSWQKIIVGNDTQVQYTTLPTPDSSNEGKIVQYTGPTDANYTNGYYYQVVSDEQDPATYSWVNINVQPSSSEIQVSTMPTASAETVGKIIQYVGTTDANYTNGYFYIGTTDGQDPATYSWSNLNVQDGNKVFLLDTNIYTEDNPFIFEEHELGRYYFMISNSTDFDGWYFYAKGKKSDTNVKQIGMNYSYDYIKPFSYLDYFVDINDTSSVKKAKIYYGFNERSNGNDASYGITSSQINYSSAQLFLTQPSTEKNFLMTDLAQTITGKKVFSQLPESSVVPTTNNQLVNKKYVDDSVAAIETTTREIVQTLPTQDIDTDTIYMVPKSTPGTQNVYDEYMYINNSWEKIGDTEIDLSNYIAKDNTTAYTPTGDYEPSTKKYVDDAVANIDVSGKEDKTNKTTTVTSSSTDTQYASAKAVYDYVEGRLGDIDTILTEILNGSVNGEGMSF